MQGAFLLSFTDLTLNLAPMRFTVSQANGGGQ